MAGSVSSIPQWYEILEPTLQELFTAGLEESTQWKQYWKQEKADKYRLEYVEWSRPDVVELTPESSPYATLQISKIRSAVGTISDYTGRIEVSHQLIREKKYDEINEKSWGLGEAVSRKLAEDAASNFYNGFSSVLGPDALSVFNTAHVCANQTGTTWANRTATPLSADALDAAQVLMMKTKNENGKITPYGTGKNQLIVPPALARLGKQLEMKGEYEPGAADFNRNVFEIETIVDPFLAQSSSYTDTMWFLRDQKRAKNIYALREGPIFDSFVDPDTDALIIKVRIAYVHIWASARGVFGSTGA